MDADPCQPRSAPAIRSVSLADLEFDRPTRFDWLKGLARTALMLWGALSFGAAAGTAAYYFAGTSDPILVSQRRPRRTRSRRSSNATPRSRKWRRMRATTSP